MSRRVVVYNHEGKGVSSDAAKNVSRWLMRFLVHRKIAVEFVSAADIFKGRAFLDTLAIVFPGGHSRFFQRALSGEANKNIREFVYHGGGYLGICGGAYYATKRIEFSGKEFSLVADTELALINGVAQGSVPELASGRLFTETIESANVVEILYSQNAGQKETCPVYYHGGPRFITNPHQQTEALARYDLDGSIAALKAVYGFGNVVLSGVHPELYSSGGAFIDNVANANKSVRLHCERMRETLKLHQEQGRDFSRFLLTKLLNW